MNDAHHDIAALRPLHDSHSRSQVVILQRGQVIVHHRQGVPRLDQVVVVHPQVLKVMCQCRIVGCKDLRVSHDLCNASVVQQHVCHLHH